MSSANYPGDQQQIAVGNNTSDECPTCIFQDQSWMHIFDKAFGEYVLHVDESTGQD